MNVFDKKGKNLLILFFTSILIFLNWGTWIYAISINKIIDASYGYFIFPILNVFLGYIFLNEKINLISFQKETEKTDLIEEFKFYLNNLYYIDDNYFVDGIHLKNKEIINNNRSKIIKLISD